MKTYKPGQVPDNPANVPGFLRQETASIQRAANAADPFAEFQTLHEAPARLRDGMVVLADGSDWDPGYGAGLYVYLGGEWVFLSSSSLQLSVAASELQRLVFLGEEQLKQLTKIYLLLCAMSGLSVNDQDAQLESGQLRTLTKIATALTVIGGVVINDDEISIPTY